MSRKRIINGWVTSTMMMCALAAFAQSYSESFVGQEANDQTVLAALKKSPNLKSAKFNQAPNVTDASVAMLAGHKDLEIIEIYQCNLSGANLGKLKDLPKLYRLSMVITPVMDDNLQELALLNLKDLILTETPVGDRAAWYISYAPTLEHLDLSKTNVTDTGVGYLKKLPRLRFLYLRDDPSVTDASAELLFSLKNLEVLDMRKTSITDKTVQMVGGLPKLKQLYVGTPMVTDQGLACLNGNRSIITLDISDSQATNQALSIIASMPALQNLSLWRTHITPDALAVLKKDRPKLFIQGPE